MNWLVLIPPLQLSIKTGLLISVFGEDGVVRPDVFDGRNEVDVYNTCHVPLVSSYTNHLDTLFK